MKITQINKKLIYFFILFFLIFSTIGTNQIFATGKIGGEEYQGVEDQFQGTDSIDGEEYQVPSIDEIDGGKDNGLDLEQTPSIDGEKKPKGFEFGAPGIDDIEFSMELCSFHLKGCQYVTPNNDITNKEDGIKSWSAIIDKNVIQNAINLGSDDSSNFFTQDIKFEAEGLYRAEVTIKDQAGEVTKINFNVKTVDKTAPRVILKGITSEYENVYVNEETPRIKGINGEIEINDFYTGDRYTNKTGAIIEELDKDKYGKTQEKKEIPMEELFTMYFKDRDERNIFLLNLDINDYFGKNNDYNQYVSGIQKIYLIDYEDELKKKEIPIEELDKGELRLNTNYFYYFKHEKNSQKKYKVRFVDGNGNYSEILFYAVRDNMRPNFSPYLSNVDTINTEGNLDFIMYKNEENSNRDHLFTGKESVGTKNLKAGNYTFKLNITDNSLLSKTGAKYKVSDIEKYNAGINGNLIIQIEREPGSNNYKPLFPQLDDRFINKNIESPIFTFELEPDSFQKKYNVKIDSIIGNGKIIKDKLCDLVGNCINYSGFEIKIGEKEQGGKGIKVTLSQKGNSGNQSIDTIDDGGDDILDGGTTGYGKFNNKMLADGKSSYSYYYSFDYLEGGNIRPKKRDPNGECLPEEKHHPWCIKYGVSEDIKYEFVFYNGLANGQDNKKIFNDKDDKEKFNNNGVKFEAGAIVENSIKDLEIITNGNETIISYKQIYNKGGSNKKNYGKFFLNISSILPTFGGYPYLSSEKGYENRLYLKRLNVKEVLTYNKIPPKVETINYEMNFSNDFNKENFLLDSSPEISDTSDGENLSGLHSIFSTKEETNKDFIDDFYKKQDGYGKIENLKEKLKSIPATESSNYKIEYDFFSPILHYNVGLGNEDNSSGTGDKENNTFDLKPIKTLNTINSYKKYIKKFSKEVKDIKVKEKFLMGISEDPYDKEEVVINNSNSANNEFYLLNKKDTGNLDITNNVAETEEFSKIEKNIEDYKKGVDYLIKLQPRKNDYEISKKDNLRLGYVSFITYKLGNKKITLPSVSRNITNSGDDMFDENDMDEKEKKAIIPQIYPGKKGKEYKYNPKIDSVFYPKGYSIMPDSILDGGYLASMGIGVVGLQKAGETMLGKNSEIDKNTVRIYGLDNAFSKTREVLYRNINKYDTSVLEAEKQKRNNIKWCKANTSDKYFKIGNNELNLTPDDSINLNNSIDKCTIKNGENEYITFIDSNVVFDCGDGQNCLLNNKEVGTRSFVIRGASYIKSNISTFENKKDNGKGIFISTIAQDNLEKVGSGLLDKNNPTIAPRKGWTFVDPRVTNIDAFIYSDGPVVSGSGNKSLTKNEMQLFNQPSNKDLNNQLHIYGALISTNTVGGYRGGEKNRVCPNFTLLKGKDCSGNASFIFDLSMLRRYSTEGRIGKNYIKVTNNGLASGGKKKIITNKIEINKKIEFVSGYNCNNLRCIKENIDLIKYPLVIERNPNWDKNPSFLFKIDY